MERTNFDLMIGNLYDYFNYKSSPTEKQLTMWFSRLQDIPDAAISYIKTAFESNEKGMPRNVPSMFKQFYQEWMGNGGVKSKRMHKQYSTDCFDCNNHGEIRGELDGFSVLFLFRCGSCDRWYGKLGRYVPAATPEILVRDGYRVVVESMSRGERVKGAA